MQPTTSLSGDSAPPPVPSIPALASRIVEHVFFDCDLQESRLINILECVPNVDSRYTVHSVNYTDAQEAANKTSLKGITFNFHGSSCFRGGGVQILHASG